MCKESHKKVKEAVARGWCYPKTENKVMDPDLVEAISLEVDSLFHKIQAENAASLDIIHVLKNEF